MASVEDVSPCSSHAFTDIPTLSPLSIAIQSLSLTKTQSDAIITCPSIPLQITSMAEARARLPTETSAQTPPLRQSNAPITRLPNEILVKIGEDLDPAEYCILGITCKCLRAGFPPIERPSLEYKSRIKGWCFEHEIKFADLLKEFMKPRIYAGNYGIFKFVGGERYNLLRDAYWDRYPQLPFMLLDEDKIRLGVYTTKEWIGKFQDHHVENGEEISSVDKSSSEGDEFYDCHEFTEADVSVGPLSLAHIWKNQRQYPADAPQAIAATQTIPIIGEWDEHWFSQTPREITDN